MTRPIIAPEAAAFRNAPGYRKSYVGDASHIHPGLGLGLFAKKGISRGETIFIARGIVVHMEEAEVKDPSLYPNALGLTSEKWLEPAPDNPLRYTNHSCDPTMGIRGAVTFVAMRDVEAGEHLTFDYSTTEGDLPWQVDARCKCGSANCRGVIRAIQFLPHELYLKYLPNIPREFQSVYMKYRRSQAGRARDTD